MLHCSTDRPERENTQEEKSARDTSAADNLFLVAYTKDDWSCERDDEVKIMLKLRDRLKTVFHEKISSHISCLFEHTLLQPTLIL